MMYTPVRPVAQACPVRVMGSSDQITTTDGRVWKYVGRGSYNYVYRSTEEDGRSFVYKLPIHGFKEPTESPDRAVRIWNIINSHLDSPAVALDDGWVAPFIHGTKPSNMEICHALIDIYMQTQRIVTDPDRTGNFIRQADGRVVCVDVGFALKMNVDMSKSNDSIDCWNSMSSIFDNMLSDECDPLIANTTRALLFLARNHPEIRNIAVLKENTTLVKRLSDAYFNSSSEQNLDLAVLFPDEAGQLAASQAEFLSIKERVLQEIQSNMPKTTLTEEASATARASFFYYRQGGHAMDNALHDLSQTNNLPSLVRLLSKIDTNNVIEDFPSLFVYPFCFQLLYPEHADIFSGVPATPLAVTEEEPLLTPR